MPKKNMTLEEKKAWGAKMKALREAKKAVLPTPEPQDDSIESANVQELMRQVQELKARLDGGQPTTPELNRGKLVGTYEKYIVDGDYYPNPIERLKREERLQRFAFPINYELDFKVMPTTYETIDGVRTKEPRFVLELRRVVMDDDGNPTSKRYVISRLTFHEDPEAAIVIAQDNGITVNANNERDFLNEMRYLRMRDWLLETFYPPKPQKVQNKKEEVIGNRLVEVFEISSETSERIPFSELNSRL